MQCPRCQHENPPQAKFCLECGARVALTCTKCRSELPAGAKFCLECGASQTTAEPRFTSPESYTPKHLAEKILTSKTALEGERKQVTVLFADLKGSMELLADRDPWVVSEEITVRPEDTLRMADIRNQRQAKYQRRMSSLLAGR
jgi:ribosomal protein L40E